MKNLLFLFLPLMAFSQSTTKIIIEVDNSQQIIYENTLNRLKADSYKKAAADMIEDYGNRYFKELKVLANLFTDLDPKYIPYLNQELDKLKKNGYDIFNLLPGLADSSISPEKMKNTIQNSFDELHNYGNTKEFKTLVMYSRLSKDYSQ